VGQASLTDEMALDMETSSFQKLYTTDKTGRYFTTVSQDTCGQNHCKRFCETEKSSKRFEDVFPFSDTMLG
jgi:hypothetical protein